MSVIARTLASPVRSAVLSVAIGLLGVVGLAWLSLLIEMPPAGDLCHFELDVGSGPSGTGTEAIDWNYGLFPGRVCGYELDEADGPRVYARTSLFRALWPLVAAVLAAGTYVVIRGIVWLSERPHVAKGSPRQLR